MDFARFGTLLNIQTGALIYRCLPEFVGPVTVADVTVDLGTRMLTVEATDTAGMRVPVDLLWLMLTIPRDAQTIVREVWANRIPVQGLATIGPFPPGVVEGLARYGDGFRVLFGIDPARGEVLRIKRPETAALRVAVCQGARAVPDASVFASSLRVDGAKAGKNDEIAPGTAQQEGRTGEDGVAALVVAPGTLRIEVTRSLGEGWTGKLEIAAGELREIAVVLR